MEKGENKNMSHSDHKAIYKQRDERGRKKEREKQKDCVAVTSSTQREYILHDCIENCIFIFIFMDTQLICFELFPFSFDGVCVFSFALWFSCSLLLSLRSFFRFTLRFGFYKCVYYYCAHKLSVKMRHGRNVVINSDKWNDN